MFPLVQEGSQSWPIPAASRDLARFPFAGDLRIFQVWAVAHNDQNTRFQNKLLHIEQLVFGHSNLFRISDSRPRRVWTLDVINAATSLEFDVQVDPESLPVLDGGDGIHEVVPSEDVHVIEDPVPDSHLVAKEVAGARLRG